MRYVKPDSKDAAFHFSVEEYFMEHTPLSKPLFMIWQADNCAMLGANQVAQAEVNLACACENNIQTVRRLSGGGAIFTDLGTLLYTLILPDTNQKSTAEVLREAVAGPMVRALYKLGIPAYMEGRNDLLADGRKFSGMAQYVRKGRVCTHGSLMVNTDLDLLTRVLQVDEDKILSKGIKSVRSRVTNLCEHMKAPVTAQEFWMILEGKLAEEWMFEPYNLSSADLTVIDNIRQERFATQYWTFGKSPPFTLHRSMRFLEGKIELFLDVAQGSIRTCTICGDFLATRPIGELEKKLEGAALQYEAIDAILTGCDLTPYLGDIAKEQVLEAVFGEVK